MASSSCVSSSRILGADSPRVEVQRVTDNVYVLLAGKGLGANVGVVVGDESIVLIDSMNASSYSQLRKAVRKLSDKPIEFVINTHHHSDHTGGNDALMAEGVLSIGHVNALYSDTAPQQMVPSGFRLKVGDEVLQATRDTSTTD